MTVITTSETAKARAGSFSAFVQPVTLTSLIIIGVLALSALLAPLISPYDPNVNDLASAYGLPSAQHWLGTDELGRDLLSRVMHGGRVSLLGVAEALAIYMSLGITFGILAGYLGGVLDSVVVWISEITFAMPQIIVVLSVLAIFSNNSAAAMLALGILGAPGLAVFVRGATRSVKEELYIAAARVSGLNGRQIMMRHILPQITGPVIVQASLFAGTALLFQTGMDFLGLGTQPPTASWGAMVAGASQYLFSDPWMVLPSGTTIVLAIISFGLIGDALEDRRSTKRQRKATAVGSSPVPQRTTDSARSNDMAGTEMPAPPGSILSVRGLSVVTTGGTTMPVVEDISFDLRAGECLGVVGESGSGKTMTALSVIGLLPEGLTTSKGSILYKGRELRNASEKVYAEVRGSGIGMISQEPIASLDPSFTVEQQITQVLKRHSKLSSRAARAEALELLERVKIPNPAIVAQKYPHQLSGGMAQRVSIAAALAAKPDILIADEPTTALDVTVQADILSLLRSLRSDGLAVILVSHDWGVIADSCDSAVVLYAGQVIEHAPIETLFNTPKHPYTYALMAANPEYAQPRKELPAVAGTVPPVGQWPTGCHFAARCPFATEKCKEAPIPLFSLTTEHLSRCIHTEDVPEAQLEATR